MAREGLTELRRLESATEDVAGLRRRATDLLNEAGDLANTLAFRRVEFQRLLARLVHKNGIRLLARLRKRCVCQAGSLLDCRVENRGPQAQGDGGGIEIDRRVVYQLSAEPSVAPPPYSTCRSASSRLKSRLAREGIAVSTERTGGLWYCVLRRASDRSMLATGSASRLPLAICRAVLSLDFGRIHSVTGAAAKRPKAAPAAQPEIFRCRVCGAEDFGKKKRDSAICNLCSWRAISKNRGQSRKRKRVLDPNVAVPESV